MRRVIKGLAVAIVVATAAGCATRPHPPVSSSAPVYGQQRAEYGQVHSIDLVSARNQTTGAGGLVGGVLGAVVGRQIGSGSGRSVGTLVGAVGGAVIGNEIEKNQRGARDFYRVAIRTERGEIRAFDYAQLAELQVGDRVRIENNQVYRY